MSSVLMVLALNAIQRGDKLWNRIWLIGCAFFGMVFLGVEIHEFHGLWMNGMAYQTNLFSQCFYTLVGTHGLHVTVGLVWMVILAVQVIGNKQVTDRDLTRLTCLSLFWHFLDIVWICVFTFVYLASVV